MLPLAAMLLGAVLDRVAVPPLTDKTKSLVARAPLPPLVLYAGSLKVTATVLLSAARATDDILGTIAVVTVSYVENQNDPTKNDPHTLIL